MAPLPTLVGSIGSCKLVLPNFAKSCGFSNWWLSVEIYFIGIRSVSQPFTKFSHLFHWLILLQLWQHSKVSTTNDIVEGRVEVLAAACKSKSGTTQMHHLSAIFCDTLPDTYYPYLLLSKYCKGPSIKHVRQNLGLYFLKPPLPHTMRNDVTVTNTLIYYLCT